MVCQAVRPGIQIAPEGIMVNPDRLWGLTFLGKCRVEGL